MVNRRRGGQPGNQNARKHGYYSKALTGEDRHNLRQASEVTGLDDEIALLRARIKSIVQHDPDNLRLISEAASTLARLLRTNHKLGFGQANEFEEARWDVLQKYQTCLGVNIDQLAALFLEGFDGLRKWNSAAGLPGNIFSTQLPSFPPKI